ncbi:MAG: GDSL-type esterase/lipase family protein [Bacteroidota bacterium]
MRQHFLLGVLLLSWSFSFSQLSLNPLFQDHAVLQRDESILIKGSGTPGMTVQITLADQESSSIVDMDSTWTAVLSPMAAGGPFELSVISGDEAVVLRDLLIGDVWLLSGQSNMEWPLSMSDGGAEEIACPADTRLRHYKVPLTGGPELRSEVSGGSWIVDTTLIREEFSAVGYFFAKELLKESDVAIGLLNSSWGGSRIEPWIPAETLGYDSPAAAERDIMAANEDRAEEIRLRLEPIVGQLDNTDDGTVAGRRVWGMNNFPISDWETMEAPGVWESQMLADFDGVVWMAKEVMVNEDIVGVSTLRLAMIDDNDETYVNGVLVGSTNSYNTPREYTIPEGTLHKGVNRITIRVEDTGGGGGIHGDVGDMSLRTNAGDISLAGSWKYKASAQFNSKGLQTNQTPMYLYNHMIHPLHGFPIKGMLWYQGESNGSLADAIYYEEQIVDMIKVWRDRWGIGDIPFYAVQLANWLAPNDRPKDHGWARIREAHAALSDRLNNTGDVVTIDIGDAGDIHPRNKKEVGRRLALLARSQAYEEEIPVWNSPRYVDCEVVGDRVRLTFDHVGTGLEIEDKYGYPKGFAITGDHGQWEWARAELVSPDQIEVRSPHITNPVAVRYAWAINPDDANVVNSAGLPLSPFRTDNWNQPMRYLALGDSYTVGTSVEHTEAFPYQLAAALASDTAKVEVDMIATNGWTTTDLLQGINDSGLQPDRDEYDLVTLLIGVNNQYQGKDFSLYQTEFVELLDQAIDFVGGDASKVVVVSIPDYAKTPFGRTRPDPKGISDQLDEYNDYARRISSSKGTSYVYITDITRPGSPMPSLVAVDDLHPSGVVYKEITDRIIDAIRPD